VVSNVFVGVALAFAVENLRDDLNERDVGDQYLASFSQDLTADLEMLRGQVEARRAQLTNALMCSRTFRTSRRHFKETLCPTVRRPSEAAFG